MSRVRTFAATIPATGVTDTRLSGSKAYTHAVVAHRIDRPAITVDITHEAHGIRSVTYWAVREGWQVASYHTSRELADKAAEALLRKAERAAAKIGQDVPSAIDQVQVVEAVEVSA